MADEFEDMTIDDVSERAAAAGSERMPGSGREVPNASAQVHDEMNAEGVSRVGDLPREGVEHYQFATKQHYGKLTPQLLSANLEKPKLTGAGMEDPELLGAGGAETRGCSARAARATTTSSRRHRQVGRARSSPSTGRGLHHLNAASPSAFPRIAVLDSEEEVDQVNVDLDIDQRLQH